MKYKNSLMVPRAQGNATFWIMVLHNNKPTSSLPSTCQNCVHVKWLDGEWVDNADIDSSRGKLIGCFQCLHQRHTCPNDGYLVPATLTHNLPSNTERTELRPLPYLCSSRTTMFTYLLLFLVLFS